MPGSTHILLQMATEHARSRTNQRIIMYEKGALRAQIETSEVTQQQNA